jgi:hypothetical protein
MSRCPRCDRDGCTGIAAQAQVEQWDRSLGCIGTVGEVYRTREIANDCERNAVDWRSRCLAAEGRVTALVEALEQCSDWFSSQHKHRRPTGEMQAFVNSALYRDGGQLPPQLVAALQDRDPSAPLLPGEPEALAAIEKWIYKDVEPSTMSASPAPSTPGARAPAPEAVEAFAKQMRGLLTECEMVIGQDYGHVTDGDELDLMYRIRTAIENTKWLVGDGKEQG